jgi:threonine aldolase
MAGHANRQAAKFAKAIENHAEASLEYPVQANEVFMKWTMEGFDQLKSQGIQFEVWPGRNDLARFVFAHSTSDEETDILVKCMR